MIQLLRELRDDACLGEALRLILIVQPLHDRRERLRATPTQDLREDGVVALVELLRELLQSEGFLLWHHETLAVRGCRRGLVRLPVAVSRVARHTPCRHN